MANKKLQIIAQALYDSLESQDGAKTAKEKEAAIENAVKLLKKERLLGKSDEFLESLTKVIDNAEGIVRAEVITAHDITDSEKEKIKKFVKDKFDGTHAVIEHKIDKSVVGGIKIKVGDTLIDYSLTSRIRDLEKHLLNS